MMSEAEQLNKGFLKRIHTGFSYIQLKLDTSLDGRTAMVSGESQWITSPQVWHDVQLLHAQDRTILTGSTMMLVDDPALTMRQSKLGEQIQALYPQQDLRQPTCIVIDSQNRATPVHRIVQQPGETWFTRTREDSREWPKTMRTLLIPEHKGHLDLVVLMMQLDKQ